MPSSVATICVDKTATIHELVLYIQHNYPELNNIDLLTGNPPVSILDDVVFMIVLIWFVEMVIVGWKEIEWFCCYC